MELASYLAGERWSDHPACTHPLLAEAARLVNDHTSDDARGRLAVLVPSVIGLTSSDLHVDVRIALATATVALPVASEERQHVLALGILACERMLDDLDGRPEGTLQESSRAVLDKAPQAEQWARRFPANSYLPSKRFRSRSARRIVRCSVEGVALACIPNPDERLRDLLVAAIAAFDPARGRTREPVDLARLAEAQVRAGVPLRTAG